jgi:hypothetical protein
MEGLARTMSQAVTDVRDWQGAIAAARKVVRRRLLAQRVAASEFTRPAELVGWLGAVQAQDYLGALWAVGLRVAGARESDIERALAEGTIVRCWAMRGTLHFVAAEDARWMISLLAPRAVASAASRLKAAGVDDEVLANARRALVKNLEGGRRLTRQAAYSILERARIATAGQRGMHLLWRLAHDGLLCLGPREGKQQTFVLLEEWLPKATILAREQALPELAHRYFTGHGPATLRDFAWWSGLTLSEARLAVDMAGKLLEREVVEGHPFLFAPAAAPYIVAGADERAYVLPAFDEFFVGYADRSAAVASLPAGSVTAVEILGPVILADDGLVATWKRRLTRQEVACSTSPLVPLTRRAEAAVQLALARYAQFLDLKQGAMQPRESTRRDGSNRKKSG